MVGVHTPEFDFEKQRSQVQKVVDKYGLNHPIYMDNDYAYWNALNNRYWPSFYVVDRQGRVRMRIQGEMHEGSGRAEQVAALLEELLAEG